MSKELHNQSLAWGPAEGTWEEAVLSWHEQVEAAFRRRSRIKVRPRVNLSHTAEVKTMTSEQPSELTAA